MTFYEALGAMFLRAVETLAGGEVDNPTPRQLREVTVFLRRMHALWPELFSCLWQETSVLQKGLRELNSSIQKAGRTSPSSWLVDGQSDDPVAEYRRLVGVFDEAMTFLHDYRSEPWGAHALERLREVLAAAVRIQGRLVDLALAA